MSFYYQRGKFSFVCSCGCPQAHVWRIYEGYIHAGFAGRRHLSWLSSTAAGCGARGLDRAVLSIPRAALLLPAA